MLTTLLSSVCPTPDYKTTLQYMSSYWANNNIPYTFSIDADICPLASKALPVLVQQIAKKALDSWKTACNSAIEFIYNKTLAPQASGIWFACASGKTLRENDVEAAALAVNMAYQNRTIKTSCIYFECEMLTSNDSKYPTVEPPDLRKLKIMKTENFLGHEIGHALGFKHTHEGPLGKKISEYRQNPANHDDCSIMAYETDIPKALANGPNPNIIINEDTASDLGSMLKPGETDAAMCRQFYMHQRHIKKNTNKLTRIKENIEKFKPEHKHNYIELNHKTRIYNATIAGFILGTIDAGTELVCKNIFKHNAMTTNLIKVSTTSFSLALYSLLLDNVMLSSLFMLMSIAPVLGFYQQWHQPNANTVDEQNKRAKQLDWTRYILQIGLFIALAKNSDTTALNLLIEIGGMTAPSMLIPELFAPCINNNRVKNPKHQV